MKEYAKDTSQDYEDLVGFVSEYNLPKDLGEFFGDKTEYRPEVKPKSVDPEFSQPWQSLYVNFRCIEDYIEFMEAIGEKPVPKLKELVYNKEQDEGLLKFFGE